MPADASGRSCPPDLRANSERSSLSSMSQRPLQRRHLWYGTAALVAVVLVALGWVLGPRLALPPRSITLATGPEGGAYAELGPRYVEILRRSGITVRLLATGGDVDNLAKLRDPKSGVSAAFVQAGICGRAGTGRSRVTGDAHVFPSVGVRARGQAQPRTGGPRGQTRFVRTRGQRQPFSSPEAPSSPRFRPEASQRGGVHTRGS